MKKTLITIILLCFCLQMNAQDLISGGSNSWIFHTNDISGTVGNLHIAPKINGVWEWSKQMTLTPSGNANFSSRVGIGIGNNTPEGVFDAKSSNNMRIILNRDNQSSITFVPNIANSWFHISHGANNTLYFSQGATVGQIKLLAIHNSGNIGIGIDNPTEKLEVNGTIHAKEVRVDLTGWPDYVFAKDYELPLLSKVEKYIKQNGHLQEIPSAEEVEKNGVKLGEMNALLLQKIEELTLYAIQQEKKLEKQQEEIKKQKEANIRLEERLQKLEIYINNKK